MSNPTGARKPGSTPGPVADDMRVPLVTASLDNRMEIDKSILALSAAGIGLLVTIATTVTLRAGFQQWFAGLAVVAFLTAVISVLFVFKGNVKLIDKMFTGNMSNDRYLAFLDRLVAWSFGVGVVFTCAVAAVRIITPLQTDEVTNEQTTENGLDTRESPNH